MKKIIIVIIAIVLCIGLGVYGFYLYQNQPIDEDINVPPATNNGEEDPSNPGLTPVEVSADMTTLLEKLYEKTNIQVRMPFSAVIESARSQEYIGLSSEEFTANVVDSVVSESMISPSNYSLCLIKVKDGADKTALMNTILEKSNPGKWICVCADNVLVADAGNYIMLVMSTKEDCTNLKNALFEIYPDTKGNVIERAIGA